jgi:hypothetical protein
MMGAVLGGIQLGLFYMYQTNDKGVLPVFGAS